MNAQPARGGRWELAVEARHRAALATLATLGLVLRGSIARRLLDALRTSRVPLPRRPAAAARAVLHLDP